jgi:hypothetical protein
MENSFTTEIPAEWSVTAVMESLVGIFRGATMAARGVGINSSEIPTRSSEGYEQE